MSVRPDVVYEFGPFRVNPINRLIERDGKVVPVKPKVFDTLVALITSGGTLINKDDLIRTVWPNTVVEENNLTQNISTLRKVLGEHANDHRFIVTVPGYGYRFVAPVKQLPYEQADLLVTTQTVTRSTIEGELILAVRTESRTGRTLAAAIVVIVMLGVLLYLLSVRKPRANYPMRLTENPAADVLASWSPDGSKIAFASNRDGKPNIYVMNADGSSVKRLTTSSATDDKPTWSPDGKRIAFASDRDGNREIYVMNADGSNQIRLTHNDADDRSPSWCPDGMRIAFASNRDNSYVFNFDIWLMNVDGSNPTRLTTDPEFDSDPAWSHDGKRIALVSGRDGNFEIYAMNADGSGQTNLTRNAENDTNPAWSTDGKRIAFSSRRDGKGDLYVMDADGSNVQRLTQTSAHESWPSWSPDGAQIAFSTDRDGNSEIYV